MKCPKCGKSKAKQIAPNFYECTAAIRYKVQVRKYRPNPDQIAVREGRATPLQWFFEDEWQTEDCGTRYHVGAPSESSVTCSCGTFAIGLCDSCGQAICGDHSELLGGKRNCAGCVEMSQCGRERRAYAKYRSDAQWGATIVKADHSCEYCAVRRTKFDAYWDHLLSRYPFLKRLKRVLIHLTFFSTDAHHECRIGRKLCRNCFLVEFRKCDPSVQSLLPPPPTGYQPRSPEQDTGKVDQA